MAETSHSLSVSLNELEPDVSSTLADLYANHHDWFGSRQGYGRDEYQYHLVMNKVDAVKLFLQRGGYTQKHQLETQKVTEDFELLNLTKENLKVLTAQAKQAMADYAEAKRLNTQTVKIANRAFWIAVGATAVSIVLWVLDKIVFRES